MLQLFNAYDTYVYDVRVKRPVVQSAVTGAAQLEFVHFHNRSAVGLDGFEPVSLMEPARADHPDAGHEGIEPQGGRGA